MSVTEILKKASPVPLDGEVLAKLGTVAERLVSENEKYNLTSLVTDEDIALLHFADCLQAVKHLPLAGKRVIDIGCGGGFPALVIAAAGKCLSVTALDSTAKKLAFAAETARLAGIVGLQTLCMRAEEIKPEMREGFDLAVSRGVTRLPALCELCLPYVKVGGIFAAMKGPAAHEEAEAAAHALEALGGSLAEIIPAPVPQRGDGHNIVVIKKIRPTPAEYPRQWAKIKKNPL